MILPTWNHLWFVVYLWVYTMVLAAVAALLPRGAGAVLQAGFDRVFAGWRLVVLPILWFAAYRVLLSDILPETHALVDDWGMHLVYGFAFAFGLGLAGSATLWATIARIWRPAGVVALVSWYVVATIVDLPGDTEEIGPTAFAAFRFLRAVQGWAAILALLGFAQRYLNRDSPWRATLNEAVFPAYIAHQTVIIVVAYWLRPAALSNWAEFAILVPATAAGSALFYLIARELPWLRPFAGLRAAGGRARDRAPLSSGA